MIGQQRNQESFVPTNEQCIRKEERLHFGHGHAVGVVKAINIT